jgi:hypothetical protein
VVTSATVPVDEDVGAAVGLVDGTVVISSASVVTSVADKVVGWPSVTTSVGVEVVSVSTVPAVDVTSAVERGASVPGAVVSVANDSSVVVRGAAVPGFSDDGTLVTVSVVASVSVEVTSSEDVVGPSVGAAVCTAGEEAEVAVWVVKSATSVVPSAPGVDWNVVVGSVGIPELPWDTDVVTSGAWEVPGLVVDSSEVVSVAGTSVVGAFVSVTSALPSVVWTFWFVVSVAAGEEVELWLDAAVAEAEVVTSALEVVVSSASTVVVSATDGVVWASVATSVVGPCVPVAGLLEVVVVSESVTVEASVPVDSVVVVTLSVGVSEEEPEGVVTKIIKSDPIVAGDMDETWTIVGPSVPSVVVSIGGNVVGRLVTVDSLATWEVSAGKVLEDDVVPSVVEVSSQGSVVVTSGVVVSWLWGVVWVTGTSVSVKTGASVFDVVVWSTSVVVSWLCGVVWVTGTSVSAVVVSIVEVSSWPCWVAGPVVSVETGASVADVVETTWLVVVSW